MALPISQNVIDFYKPYRMKDFSHIKTQNILGHKFKIDKRYEVIDTGTFFI